MPKIGDVDVLKHSSRVEEIRVVDRRWGGGEGNGIGEDGIGCARGRGACRWWWWYCASWEGGVSGMIVVDVVDVDEADDEDVQVLVVRGFEAGTDEVVVGGEEVACAATGVDG